MYRLLIVDDETAIRKGLTNFIAWNELGCSVVGEASNGLEAVEKIVELSPDIIITDIKMPGMNGNELAQYVYDHQLHSKVIILTGYADFSYAQTALRYGVLDFLLKPTAKDKVIEAVRRATILLEEERQKESTLMDLQDELSASLPELRQNFLRELLLGLPTAVVQQRRRALQLGIAPGGYYLLVFRMDHTAASQQRNPAHDLNDALINMIHMAFFKEKNVEVSVDTEIICCLVKPAEQDSEACYQLLLGRCEEILQIISTFADFFVSIGISAPHDDICNLSQAYQEALQALSLQFYSENQVSVYMGERSEKRDYDTQSVRIIDQILAYISENRMEEATSETKILFERYQELRLPIEQLKNVCIQICSACSRLLNLQNAMLGDAVDGEQVLYQNILHAGSFHYLSNLMQQLLHSVSDYVAKDEPTMHGIIKKALTYMHTNFVDSNLTLESVSLHTHLNSSYFSRLFHQETGGTFTDVLTSIRMEKAKMLLSDSDARTYEVAQAVGIDDPGYFSQLFKKHTGQTPKEYRRSRQ